MSYTPEQLLGKDLDWFFNVGNIEIHAASAGGMLPESINEQIETQKALKSRPYLYEKCEIVLNPNLRSFLNLGDQKEHISFILESCNIKSGEDAVDTYIQRIYSTSFVRFARKGFVSFDRTNIDNPEDNNYHVVAYPLSVLPNIVVCGDMLKVKRYYCNADICSRSYDLVKLAYSQGY